MNNSELDSQIIQESTLLATGTSVSNDIFMSSKSTALQFESEILSQSASLLSESLSETTENAETSDNSEPENSSPSTAPQNFPDTSEGHSLSDSAALSEFAHSLLGL